MICNNCGNDIPDGVYACPSCGTPVPGAGGLRKAITLQQIMDRLIISSRILNNNTDSRILNNSMDSRCILRHLSQTLLP